NLISNYTNLLAIGITFLTIIFAVIQITYKRLSIITLLLENTFFAPVFYFGLINTLTSSVFYLYSSSTGFLSDFYFARFVNIEIKNEIEAIIPENKTVIIQKFFELYSYASETNFTSLLLNYFRFYLKNWLTLAKQTDSFLSLQIITSGWWDIYKQNIISRNP